MSPMLKKLLKRTALLAAIGIVLSQMLPSLADQLTPNPVSETLVAGPVAEPSPSPSESSSDAPEVAPSSEPVADVTYLEVESPTAKAKVIDSDSLFFRVPNSLQVDPRAISLHMDSFALGGTDDILMCISSDRANLAINSNQELLLEGQGSQSLLLSGSISKVLAALTAGHGMTLTAGGRISGTNLTFQLVALTKPSIDPGLCGASQITRSVIVKPLGVDLGIVKVPLNLGKR